MTQQQAPNLIKQVRSSATRLIKDLETSDGFIGFRWLDDAGNEGRELYNRVRELHDVARNVEVAMGRREEQLRDEGIKSLQGEDVVWKKTSVFLDRCHHVLNNLRKLLIGWDAEFEPNRVTVARLHFKLNFLQKRKILELHSKLNWMFQALQLNANAVNQFMQVDTQERIGQTNVRLDEINVRLNDMSDKIFEEMQTRYEQLYEQLYEQQQVIITALQGLRPPSFSMTAPPIGRKPSVSLPTASTSNSRITESHSNDESDYDDCRVSQSCDDEDIGEENVDRRILDEALEETRSFRRGFSTRQHGSSIAMESYNASESSTSDRHRNRQQRLDSNPNTQVVIATAGDYVGGIVQISKKPEIDYDELLKEHHSRSKTCLRQGQYDLAEEHLIRAIELARVRKEYYKTEFDEIGMQDLLGKIYLQANRFQRALGVWVELLPRRNDPEQEITLQHCHHFHLVAETFYRWWKEKKQKRLEASQDLSDARKNAESAYNKRVELLGNIKAPEVKISADLLARILDAQGETADAKFYRSRADGVTNQDLDLFELTSPDDDGTLQEGQKPTWELYRAIRENNVPRALALLKNVDLQFELERYMTKDLAKKQCTLLMMAFDAGSEPIVNALLERKANITATDADGRTVLHRTAASGNANMTRLATRNARNGSLEQTDDRGLTPLLLAVEKNETGALEVADLLLNEEADINALNRGGENVVHLAARNSSRSPSSKDLDGPARAAALLRYLVHDRHSNSPINGRDNLGNTPLMISCENGSALTAETLLKAGADVNARNHRRQSALYFAVVEHPVIPKYEGVVTILLNHNAEVIDKELPRKWKDFRHLVHRSPALGAATTGDHQRNASLGSNSLSPNNKSKEGKRRESGASAASHGARKASVSTMETTASRSSSTISRMLSWPAKKPK